MEAASMLFQTAEAGQGNITSNFKCTPDGSQVV